MKNKTLKICMAGFGNVGQNFARLVQAKQRQIARMTGHEIVFSGISTRSRGTLANPRGLDLDEVFAMIKKRGRFDPERPDYLSGDALAMMTKSKAHLFCELTPLSIRDGQPAARYIESAFHHGMDVISANKGPEAWHYQRLKELADKKGRRFLFETIVMDGTPVFNLVRHTLPGVRINRIRGILNSTSNFVLTCMEQGMEYDQALKRAQASGVAETDPAMDMEGFDGAAKICCLANILMDAGATPADVAVTSLAGIRGPDILKARDEGCRIKYICEAGQDKAGGRVHLSVTPERIPLDHPYGRIKGTSSVITFYTDLAGEFSVVQTNPGILQTAYGVYSDLLTLLGQGG